MCADDTAQCVPPKKKKKRAGVPVPLDLFAVSAVSKNKRNLEVLKTDHKVPKKAKRKEERREEQSKRPKEARISVSPTPLLEAAAEASTAANCTLRAPNKKMPGLAEMIDS